MILYVSADAGTTFRNYFYITSQFKKQPARKKVEETLGRKKIERRKERDIRNGYWRNADELLC